MSDENPYRRPGESSQDWHSRYDDAKRRYQESGGRGDPDELKRLELEHNWDVKHANKELDELLPTVEEEAKFLAKVLVWARHFSRDKEFIELLEKVVGLKPQKVLDAAEMFGRLSRIYDDLGTRAGEAHGHVKKYWKGETAEAFATFFVGDEHAVGMIGKIFNSQYSLSKLASGTARLLNAFGDSLIMWRNEVAKAIKTQAAKDRERESSLVSEVWDVVTTDQAQAGAQLVDAFIKILRSVEQKHDDENLIWFDEFAKSQDAKRTLPDESEYIRKKPESIDMPEPRVV